MNYKYIWRNIDKILVEYDLFIFFSCGFLQYLIFNFQFCTKLMLWTEISEFCYICTFFLTSEWIIKNWM